MASLRVRELNKAFNGTKDGSAKRVLNDISFEILGPKFVSVLGKSGCGKTTLLNIVSGVERPTSGEVVAEGDSAAPARLGYVFQEPRLLPWRTVMDNMLYVQADRSEKTRQRMLEHLDLVGLRACADYFPAQLSGGMQQRVGIVRAFSVSPDLLLMDEPFSHLDAITARDLQAQLQELWLQTKKTVLFVTHDVLEAVQLSDRVIVLDHTGHLQEDISIDLPRPRRQSDPIVATAQAELLARLESTS